MESQQEKAYSTASSADHMEKVAIPSSADHMEKVIIPSSADHMEKESTPSTDFLQRFVRALPAYELQRSLTADMLQRLAEPIPAELLESFPASLPADLRQRLATPIPADEVQRMVANLAPFIVYKQKMVCVLLANNVEKLVTPSPTDRVLKVNSTSTDFLQRFVRALPAYELQRMRALFTADMLQRLAEPIPAELLESFPASLPADLRQRLATPIPADEVVRMVAYLAPFIVYKQKMVCVLLANSMQNQLAGLSLANSAQKQVTPSQAASTQEIATISTAVTATDTFSTPPPVDVSDLLSKKNLALIVDLDQTILHSEDSYKIPTDMPNVKFYQGQDQSGTTYCFCFAFRPGLSDALEQWSKM